MTKKKELCDARLARPDIPDSSIKNQKNECRCFRIVWCEDILLIRSLAISQLCDFFARIILRVALLICSNYSRTIFSNKKSITILMD